MMIGRTTTDWFLNSNGSCVCGGANGRPVAFISRDRKAWKANARVIAAAPELLAALEAFTKAMDMHLGHQHEVAICGADDQARDAIAKVTE